MTAAPAPPKPEDPYQIFARARAYWEAASYPSSISYTIAVSVARRGVESTSHYHAHYDSTRDVVRIGPVSDEELAHPYTPHGINTFLNIFGGGVPLSAPQRTFDYLGIPLLAPNYSFGIAAYTPHTASAGGMALVEEIRREFHDPPPPGKAKYTPLKTIADVTVAQRRYIISFAGTVPLNGHTDYDLKLKPVTDPERYRLRELWVNAQTYATDRLVSDGNFTSGAFLDTLWTVDFQTLNGAPLIASERTFSRITIDRRTYDTASISFTSITTSSNSAFLQGLSPSPSSNPPPLTEPVTQP